MTPFLGGIYALAALVVIVVGFVMSGRQIASSTLVLTAPRAVPAAPSFTTYVHPPGDGIAHAVTAIALPGGRLAAYWFAGSREAGPDVSLRGSLFDGATWSAPRVVTDGRRTGADQHRFVKTVGNPVVFRHPGGEYWLIYVSVSVGGWSGSALNLMRSTDGIEWGQSVRLVSGPFANVSTLVKAPPLVRADGLIALPAYHEFVAAYPELILIDADARVVDKVRMGAIGQIQPWAVAIDSQNVVALMRAFHAPERRLWTATSTDAGASWDTPRTTALANPDSPAAAVALPGGRIVAVLNDDAQRSEILDLVISDDGGKTWRHGPPVFDGGGEGHSYRYPWLLQDESGRLHVFATEASRAIRHTVLGADALALTP